MIVDKVPRGAGGELEQALQELHAEGWTRFVLGLRDVLDDPETVRREWKETGAEEAIHHFYDAVWIYGDRRVFDPVVEYQFGSQVAAKVSYSGYLTREEPESLAAWSDADGALGHFANATIVVHARELQAARAAQDPISSGYVREDYDRRDLRWQLVEGELDLFGDGTIRLLQTAGHSAGHMSLLLELEETGPVLLTADAADNRAHHGKTDGDVERGEHPGQRRGPVDVAHERALAHAQHARIRQHGRTDLLDARWRLVLSEVMPRFLGGL